MKYVQIEFSKTISAGYGNVRVGAHVDLDEGEDRDTAFRELVAWAKAEVAREVEDLKPKKLMIKRKAV